ncbi:MAG: hypothetical protein KatS3mg111_2088 [Pirellulaceae bacterium]|nr:MAG: hypothetical protein KatS3mg111_2088 [Pirellulaceae bacterium]
MKFLRNSLDKLHPLFDKGGKFEKLYPLYEALDTFLYTPGQVTRGLTHIRDALDLKRMMIMVVIALVPCVFMAMWNTGYQAHLAIEAMEEAGLQPAFDWHHSVQVALGRGHDPDSFLDNLLYGAIYFLPVYLVCMTAGGICEVVFSIVRGHEVNEGFFSLRLVVSFDPSAGHSVVAGRSRNHVRRRYRERDFRRYRSQLYESGAHWASVPVFCLRGADQRR